MDKYYTYRIKPTEEQKVLLVRYTGCYRWVYNKTLEQKVKGYIHGNRIVCTEMMKQVSELRKEHIWLQQCPAQVLQMALRQLDNDCLKFKQGQPIPRFLSKKRDNSIRFPQGIVVIFKNNTITIPKIGKVTCLYDRKFKGKIKTVTLYKTATDKYYVRIHVDNQLRDKIKMPVTESTSIGISQGINTWYALSNGTRISKPKRISDSERNLKLQQKSLARKVKGSNRSRKQLAAVLKAKEKLNNRKRDYLQKVTTKLIIEYDTIVMEAGDDSLKALLRYKSLWYGKNLVEIGKCPPCPDICSTCGIVNRSEGVSWICPSCSTTHNRNHNNALNVKRIGLWRQSSGANTQV